MIKYIIYIFFKKKNKKILKMNSNIYQNYIPKIQRSTIQNILYPKFSSKMNFIHHKEYLSLLKKVQENNKENKEMIKKEKELKKEEKLYKLKCFENIPSKYEKQTKEWIEKEIKIRRPNLNHNYINYNNKNIKIPYYERDGFFLNDKNVSLFDKYYDKIKKRKKLNKCKSQSFMINNPNKLLIYKDNNLNNNDIKIKNLRSNSLEKKNINENKKEISFNSYIILPKLEHNYIKENIEEIKNKNTINKKRLNYNFVDKNYGKMSEHLIELENKNKILNEEEEIIPNESKIICEEKD